MIPLKIWPLRMRIGYYMIALPLYDIPLEPRLRPHKIAIPTGGQKHEVEGAGIQKGEQ